MKTIVIDESKCNGCGACVPKCHEGAIKLVKGKARVSAKRCDHAGACIGQCPQGAISFKEDGKVSCEQPTSAKQWPVQLRLVSPLSPYLDNSHLLIAADCVAAAYANFHKDLLKGKVLLMGCPKFDDLAFYKQRLKQILDANTIKSITYARMEVPCCMGMKRIIEEAITESKKKIPFHEVVISVKGERL